MGKKPNFGFEKRQKDIKKQQKRADKAEKKRLKHEAAASGETPTEDGEGAEGLATSEEEQEAG